MLEPTQQEKVLLLVDVMQFSRAKADEEFEKTLEMTASLAAMLDRRGHALGLMTNGFLEGRESSLVPIARHNQQLPAILEVLARLQMKPRLRITDALRRGINLSWGLSCVCFFYQEDRTIGIMREYFKRTKIPAVFFVNHHVFSSNADRSMMTGIIYSLDSMDRKEAART